MNPKAMTIVRITSVSLVLSAGGMLAGAALARDAGAVGGAATFADMSPGNQLIASALYDAQPQSGTGTPTTSPWTLDQIVAAKADGQGWGEVFHTMKADGLIDARNLGQVVSSYRTSTVAAPPFAPYGKGALVITSGSNETSLVTQTPYGRPETGRGRGHVTGPADTVATAAGNHGHGGADILPPSGPSFADSAIITASGDSSGAAGGMAYGHSNGNGVTGPSFTGGASAVAGSPSAGQEGGIGGGHGHGRGR